MCNGEIKHVKMTSGLSVFSEVKEFVAARHVSQIHLENLDKIGSFVMAGSHLNANL